MRLGVGGLALVVACAAGCRTDPFGRPRALRVPGSNLPPPPPPPPTVSRPAEPANSPLEVLPDLPEDREGAGCENGLAHAVPFAPGHARFAEGDSITVDRIRGNAPELRVGGTYCVTGRYRSASRAERELRLWSTFGSARLDPLDVSRTVRGSAAFALRFRIEGGTLFPGRETTLQVGIYPPGGGRSIDVLYFGHPGVKAAPDYPGEEILAEGGRWALPEPLESDLLAPPSRFVRLTPWGDRYTQPRNYGEAFVTDGEAFRRVRRPEDLKPHLRPIDDEERALAFVRLVQELRLPMGDPPGLPQGTPDRFGVTGRSMEEDLKERGVDPKPVVERLPDGFEIRRLVVVRRWDKPALLRIRERVGRDGSYEVSTLETVLEGETVGRWIWRPR